MHTQTPDTAAEKSQVRRFLSYLKPYKLLFFVAIIGMVGYSAVDTFVIAQLKPFIDDSLNNKDYAYLRLAAFAIVPFVYPARDL